MQQPQQQICQNLDLPPPSHLPWDVLVLILQHVDLPQRLSSCATVNSAWHAATLAATHTILHRSSSSASTANLQDWLATHGSHLRSVHLSAAYHSNGQDLQLSVWDCPRLQAISLSHITLNHLEDTLTQSTSSSISSSSSSGSRGDAAEQSSIQQGLGFALFQNLASLSLQYCCLSSLASLAAVTGLRHLRLEKPQALGFSPAAAFTLDAAPLSHLQKLTSLQIVKGSYRELLMTACQLTNLQDLQLIRCKDIGVAGFDAGQLWQQLWGLTSLQIETVPGLLLLLSSSSSSSSSRGTVQPLQKLQRLEVMTAAGFDPLLLTSAKQLQYLHLTSTPLLGGPTGTGALLSVLSQTKDLKYLNLRGTLQHVAAGVPYVAPAADYSVVAAAVAAAAASGGRGDGAGAGGTAAVYAALTASSGLRYLDLSRCVLPPDAVPALFGGSSSSSSSSSSSGPRLPRLQHLLLADTFHAAIDMPALVAACPALRKLDITRANPHDSPLPADHLSVLSQLQHLTHMALCNVDDTAAVHLARLTHLESLSVVWQSSISDQGAQALTALRRLTQLWVHGALSSKLAPGYLLSLYSEALPSNVWCQLQEACRKAADN